MPSETACISKKKKKYILHFHKIDEEKKSHNTLKYIYFHNLIRVFPSEAACSMREIVGLGIFFLFEIMCTNNSQNNQEH